MVTPRVNPRLGITLLMPILELLCQPLTVGIKIIECLINSENMVLYYGHGQKMINSLPIRVYIPPPNKCLVPFKFF